MVIDIAESYSAHYLLLLEKYNAGLISEHRFRQYNLTLVLWQEQSRIKEGTL